MTDEPTPESVLSEVEGSPTIHSSTSNGDGRDWSASVQVVEKRGTARVIQYRDSGGYLRRCILPAEMVREALMDEGLTEEELERGIPYGEDWVAMLEGVTLPTPEMVAQALRDAGIWTAEQARANVAATRAAVATAYVPLTTAILRGSRAVQKARR